jgi:PadR family transcriptional regulator, regulatory protein PadR
MKQYQLGEFEEVVMLTVAVLYDEAYGLAVKKEIEQRLNRSVSVGALQSALQRLEEKGYLRSREGESTPDRAGRPRKYFAVTALGKKALAYTREIREDLWRSIPKIAFQNKFAFDNEITG